MTPTEPGAAHRVLLVDDDGAVRAMMNEGLQRKGCEFVPEQDLTRQSRCCLTTTPFGRWSSSLESCAIDPCWLLHRVSSPESRPLLT